MCLLNQSFELSFHHVLNRLLSPRAKPSVFLGYLHGYKGYKVLDLETNVVSISRNVIFHETVFPFLDRTLFPSPAPDLFPLSILPLPVPDSVACDFSDDHIHDSPVHPSHTAFNHVSSNFAHSRASTSRPPFPSTLSRHTSASTSALPSSEPSSVPVNDSPTLISSNNGRPKRQAHAPKYLSEYHCSLTHDTPSSPNHSLLYLICSVLSYAKIKQPYKSFVLSISTDTEPRSFAEAIKSVFWNNAMNVEYKALHESGTWSVTSLPPGKHAI